MKLNNCIIAIISCFLLAACSSAKSDAKKAILQELKDPDSAKFGKFTKVDKENACFTVNARNSFGGYTGDKEAILSKISGEWMVLTFEEISHDTCVELLERTSKEASESASTRAEQEKREAKEASDSAAQKSREIDAQYELLKKRYDLTAPDVITDTKTGLVWTRSARISRTPMKYQEATTWVQNLTLAGKTGWRLPSKEEWQEFTNINNGNQYYSETLKKLGITFTPDDIFWSSSSTPPGSTNSRWVMRDGNVYDASDDSYYVWPVHQGK